MSICMPLRDRISMALEQMLLNLIQSPSFTTEEIYSAVRLVEQEGVLSPKARFLRTDRAHVGLVTIEREKSCWGGITTYRLYQPIHPPDSTVIQKQGYELQLKQRKILSVHKIYNCYKNQD